MIVSKAIFCMNKLFTLLKNPQKKDFTLYFCPSLGCSTSSISVKLIHVNTYLVGRLEIEVGQEEIEMELVTASVTDTKEKPLHRQIRRIWKYKLLYVLLIPAFLWVLIFDYLPLYGVSIAT